MQFIDSRRDVYENSLILQPIEVSCASYLPNALQLIRTEVVYPTKPLNQGWFYEALYVRPRKASSYSQL